MKYGNLRGGHFAKNEIFDPNFKYNRDDCGRPFRLLKENFRRAGIELNTCDVGPENPLFELHLDAQSAGGQCKFRYGIIFETPIIHLPNADESLLSTYRKIFTWDDRKVGNERHIKLNVPNNIVIPNVDGLKNRHKFCCLISGNKAPCILAPVDLYSERIRTIRWFEKFRSDEFDLYGLGWNAPPRGLGIRGRIVNKIARLMVGPDSRIFFPSWRGPVKNKIDIYRNYRFVICYENAQGYEGYITEKIFDAFFAGCIPVYWGAKNVEDYIPKECFIDRRDFKAHEDLYGVLKSMDDDEYITYQRAIAEFVGSELAKPFSAEFFADTVVKEVVKDLKGQGIEV